MSRNARKSIDICLSIIRRLTTLDPSWQLICDQWLLVKSSSHSSVDCESLLSFGRFRSDRTHDLLPFLFFGHLFRFGFAIFSSNPPIFFWAFDQPLFLWLRCSVFTVSPTRVPLPVRRLSCRLFLSTFRRAWSTKAAQCANSRLSVLVLCKRINVQLIRRPIPSSRSSPSAAVDRTTLVRDSTVVAWSSCVWHSTPFSIQPNRVWRIKTKKSKKDFLFYSICLTALVTQNFSGVFWQIQ